MSSKSGWDAFFMSLSDQYWNELHEESKQHLASEDIPEDVRRAACMIHPHPVGWYDNPIPNFDMKSPRTLLKRKGGASKIREILIDIAPAFLPDANLFSSSRGAGQADEQTSTS